MTKSKELAIVNSSEQERNVFSIISLSQSMTELVEYCNFFFLFFWEKGLSWTCNLVPQNYKVLKDAPAFQGHESTHGGNSLIPADFLTERFEEIFWHRQKRNCDGCL